MTGVRVDAERPYDVLVRRGCSAAVGEHLAGVERVAVLYPAALADRVDALVAGLPQAVTRIQLPDAEEAKTVRALEDCWRRLAQAGLTRSDAVIGVGGGATTDLAGFVAATWLRGVRYVAVPTTVLAMVDAAVGGKTGINLDEGKNLVGAFYEPTGVLCDLDLLDSLPADDLRAGLAEVVKAGFIADPRILEVVEADPAAVLDPRSDVLADVIGRAIRVKAGVVSTDLREGTSTGTDVGREVLNYGHTLGHAIEHREHYRWRHGDAVSVGMVFAATLSHRLGHADAALVERHRALLATLGLPTRYDADAWPELRATMNLDKKTRGAVLRFVLLEDVARARIEAAPPEDLLSAAYAEIAR